jgi:hypothetical protein
MLGLGNSLARGGVLGFQNTYSLLFDGTDDYVDCGNDSSVQIGTGDFSLFAWVKRAGDDTQEVIFSYGNDESSGDVVYLRFQTGGNKDKLHLKIDDGVASPEALYTTGTIADTNWHHIGFTFDRDSATGVKHYIDGDLDSTHDGSSSNGDITHASDGFKIGVRKSTSLLNYFTGNIDEVAIWNAVLDADAVSTIYNSGVPIDLSIPSGNYDKERRLQGWWRMGDGTEGASGNTIYDMSSNSNDGTKSGTSGANNTPQYATDVPS